jgi:ubiquinone biosynthesis protein
MNNHLKIFLTILSHYNPISFFNYRYDNSKYLIQTGKQISKLAEDLGPIFVKLLQGLAYRIDIFPKELVNQFKDLSDNVKPEPSLIEYVNIPNLTNINVQNSGSIAQVFSGYIDNNKVAIKVKRDNIEEQIKNNRKIILVWLKLFNYFNPYLNLINRFNTIFETIEIQCDFLSEYKNQKLFLEIESEIQCKYIKIPKLYDNLCTDKYIIMEWIEGKKISNDLIKERNLNSVDIIDNIIKFTIKPLFNYDLIHGDLHPGNVLLDNNNKICILDFGLICHIEPEVQISYSNLVKYIKKKDKDKLFKWINTDFLISNNKTQIFLNTLKELIDEYFDMIEPPLGTFTNLLTKLARKHKIVVNDHLVKIEIAKHTAYSVIILIDNDYKLFSRGMEKIADYL